MTRCQVDLALEARHLWQFNYNFRHSRHVRFPFPIYPLVAPEVLVETFEEGEGISRYVADQQRSAFNSRRARTPLFVYTFCCYSGLESCAQTSCEGEGISHYAVGQQRSAFNSRHACTACCLVFATMASHATAALILHSCQQKL